jgi:hypothetical protein
MKYRALAPLWHTKDKCDVKTGEAVILDHLSPEEIKQLIDAGAVEAAPEKEQENYGANNRTDDGLQLKAGTVNKRNSLDGRKRVGKQD